MIFSTIYHQVKPLILVKQCIKLHNVVQRTLSHQIPFTELYEKHTGQVMSEKLLTIYKKKHRNIDILSYDRLQCTLQYLKKFQISALEACQEPHVLVMSPITMDNYGEILKECGFVNIQPKHIIRYHTLVKSRTLHQLKSKGLIEPGLQLQEKLLKYFDEWPENSKLTHQFDDSNTSILTIRMYVLEKYLNWKLNITSEEFHKYCHNYMPIKHKPMLDIQEAINLAQTQLKLGIETIRRNGFIISADPIHTNLILDKVPTLAGLDIREAIKREPAILKNNYNSLLQLKTIMLEHEISEEAQQNCLKVFCLRPDTIKERLDELKTQKEYQVLSSNPRVLFLVVHQRKMLKRLNKINEAKKQCFSLNHLVSSSKVFNIYISSFGAKTCGRDIAFLICNSLKRRTPNCDVTVPDSTQSDDVKFVLSQLRRHKYWLHAALHVVDENIKLLKKWFSDDVIFNNCQLLLYPVGEAISYLEFLLRMRNSHGDHVSVPLDTSYNNIDYRHLTDQHILSLFLYEMEKKYHFTGDGIWSQYDVNRLKTQTR